MSKQWANDTFASPEDFDPNNDLFFPLVLYADKTGTDINQWYLLEPWMFTTPLLRRCIRESATSWQHLGFLPSLDHIGKSAFEESGPASNESQKKLQLNHDFLSVLLQEVKYAATNKPVMMINLGGVWQKRRLHIHVSVVMGDQKSQDYLCGRKSINSGNAGRVHRSCMTSGLQASNMVAGCCLANPDVISKLNKIAMMELNECLPGPAKTISDTLPTSTTLEKCEYKKALDFLNRRVKLARNIHGRTYSMHPLRNAFDGVPFGANKHGILVATTEDHLHVCEGTIKN
jgi:hypothetical protein